MLEQSVGEWLESIGLQQYESKLLLNGFDDVRFLVSRWVGPRALTNVLAEPSLRAMPRVSCRAGLGLQPSRTLWAVCRGSDKRKKEGLCWVRVVHLHI